jgi:hypothetical protein
LRPISVGEQQAGPLRCNPITCVTDYIMRSLKRGGWAAAAILVSSTLIHITGCSQKLPPRSALELMEDPAVLQGVVHRCNELQRAALNDRECRNAREAVSRLEAQQKPASNLAAEQQFEKAREARRAREELERRRREAREKVDPYTMPLAPDMAPPVPAAESTALMSTAALPNG